jgi:hypothetical protein
MGSGCGAPTTFLAQSSVTFLEKGISGWTPVGCASENSGETLLSGARTTITGMTVEKCLNYCGQQSQTYAGIKQNTCSCSKTLNTSKVSANYACNVACDGNLNRTQSSSNIRVDAHTLFVLSEYCGAPNRVAVYSGAGPVDIPTTSQAPTISTPNNPGPTSSSTPTTPTQLVAKYGQVRHVHFGKYQLLMMIMFDSVVART